MKIPRKNYRVLFYYKENEYSEEAYMAVINARDSEELVAYLETYDVNFEIVNVMECWTIEDVKKASSIIIEGDRIYRQNTAYKDVINLINNIYCI